MSKPSSQYSRTDFNEMLDGDDGLIRNNSRDTVRTTPQERRPDALMCCFFGVFPCPSTMPLFRCDSGVLFMPPEEFLAAWDSAVFFLPLLAWDSAVFFLPPEEPLAAWDSAVFFLPLLAWDSAVFFLPPDEPLAAWERRCSSCL